MGFDGFAEAVRAEGVLPLDMRADSVQPVRRVNFSVTRKAGEFLCRAGLGPANQKKRRSGRHAAGARPALQIKDSFV